MEEGGGNLRRNERKTEYFYWKLVKYEDEDEKEKETNRPQGQKGKDKKAVVSEKCDERSESLREKKSGWKKRMVREGYIRGSIVILMDESCQVHFLSSRIRQSPFHTHIQMLSLYLWATMTDIPSQSPIQTYPLKPSLNHQKAAWDHEDQPWCPYNAEAKLCPRNDCMERRLHNSVCVCLWDTTGLLTVLSAAASSCK